MVSSDARTASRVLLRPNRKRGKVLPVEQAAPAIGCKGSPIYSLIAHGSLASTKVGRLRRITPEALHAYVSRQQARPVVYPLPQRRMDGKRIYTRVAR